jgi:hypothetical protein
MGNRDIKMSGVYSICSRKCLDLETGKIEIDSYNATYIDMSADGDALLRK